MSYRDQVLSYVSRMVQKEGRYIPKDFNFSLFNSQSDELLENAANQLYRSVEKQKSGSSQSEEKKSQTVHYYPYRSSDGSVLFMDLVTGTKIAKVYRLPNGLFSYSGSKDFLTTLGGRGELSQVITMMKDGELYTDPVSHHHKHEE